VIPVKSANLSAHERRLLECFAVLGDGDRHALLAFAEFLAQRSVEHGDERPVTLAEPDPIPRPEKESVVAALRRLSATYHMVDRSILLHQASGLMSAHVLQGRAATDVIDELEVLFRRAYEDLRADNEDA
jgi:hypothetical protein